MTENRRMNGAARAGSSANRTRRFGAKSSKQNGLTKRNLTVQQQAQEQRRLAVSAALSWLIQSFPEAFACVPQNIKPLKCGIMNDILAFAAANSCPHSKVKLRQAVHYYTGMEQYQIELCAENAMRIDLNGNPCEAVLAEHANDAQKNLAKRRKAAEERAQAAAARSSQKKFNQHGRRAASEDNKYSKHKHEQKNDAYTHEKVAQPERRANTTIIVKKKRFSKPLHKTES